MKSLISKLYLIQIKNDGIRNDIYATLKNDEKSLLEKRDNKYFLKDSERKKIKVVITGGVFDFIHMGHIYVLSEAKKHGDVLIVSLAKDEHILKKGRNPVHGQKYRAQIVKMLKPVDLVLLGRDDPKEILDIVKPDVIVYGYDQKPFLQPKGVEIVKLDSLNENEFKTGKIIEKLNLKI